MKKTNSYKECFNYIAKNKNFIYVIILLFIFSIFIGYFFPQLFSDYINEMLKQIVEKTKDMDVIKLFLFIFENNLKTSFMGMLLGIAFGFFPLLLSFFNGYILGYVSKGVIENEGALTLTKLLPHGIFELPAIFISFGLGLKLGFVLLSNIKNKKKEFFSNFASCLKVFIYIIIPLLLIAAAIEASLIFLIK